MQKGQTSDFHLMESDQPTHTARIGSHDWPAWVHDDTHMIVDLRVGRKGEKPMFDGMALRMIGVPQNLIDIAGDSKPIRGYVLVERNQCSEQAGSTRSAKKSKPKPRLN